MFICHLCMLICKMCVQNIGSVLKIELFVVLLLNFKRSSYVLDTSLIIDISFANISVNISMVLTLY